MTHGEDSSHFDNECERKDSSHLSRRGPELKLVSFHGASVLLAPDTGGGYVGGST